MNIYFHVYIINKNKFKKILHEITLASTRSIHEHIS
jgi:hypothetical protein